MYHGNFIEESWSPHWQLREVKGAGEHPPVFIQTTQNVGQDNHLL